MTNQRVLRRHSLTLHLAVLPFFLSSILCTLTFKTNLSPSLTLRDSTVFTRHSSCSQMGFAADEDSLPPVRWQVHRQSFIWQSLVPWMPHLVAITTYTELFLVYKPALPESENPFPLIPHEIRTFSPISLVNLFSQYQLTSRKPRPRTSHNIRLESSTQYLWFQS